MTRSPVPSPTRLETLHTSMTTSTMPGDKGPHIGLPTLKRTTCDTCRERKVRCDRTKPACLRCTRASHRCTYPSADGDAAKLNKAVQELQDRLARAESQLQRSASGSGPRDANLESHQQQQVPGGGLESHANPVDMHLSVLDPDSGDMRMTDTEDAAFYALDPRLVDDIASAFPSDPDQTSPSPGAPALEDDIWKFLSAADNFVPSPGRPVSTSVPRPNAVDAGRQVPSSLVATGPDIVEISSETSQRLFEVYFNVIQLHLPLINHKAFMASACPTHQAQALRCAVCMASLHACEDLRHLEHKCYSAARWHLEQAELEIRRSSVWTLEAVQALVLVARYELLCVQGPRAVLTLNRITSILEILGYDRLDNAGSGHLNTELHRPVPPASQLPEARRVYHISVAMRCCAELISPLHRGLADRDSEQQAHQHSAIVQQPRMEGLDLFDLFCLSQKIAIEADRHQRMTIAEVEGSAPPSFNFCRTHSQIELNIGGLISTLTTSSPPSGLFAGLDSELRVLTVLTALGARIQLIKTTVLHGRKAKFLEPIFEDCYKQNVSTAHDIAEVLSSARVLDPDKARIYREASLYVMPPLALAAEALLLIVQPPAARACGESGQTTSRPRLREMRQSLALLYQAMEMCQDDTGRWAAGIARVGAWLDQDRMQQREAAPFRTEFTSFAVARSGTTSTESPPQGRGFREHSPFA